MTSLLFDEIVRILLILMRVLFILEQKKFVVMILTRIVMDYLMNDVRVLKKKSLIDYRVFWIIVFDQILRSESQYIMITRIRIDLSYNEIQNMI